MPNTRGGTVLEHGTKLRPHSHLFRQGIIAVIAFMTPVFAVLYVLTIPSGPWRAVLVTQILATVVVTGASASYFRIAFWVDRTSIAERGFFGQIRRVEASEIGSVMVAEVFDSTGMKSLPQLFVRDLQGRQVLRMRGQFWSRESMDVVLATLDVPRDAREATLSTRELRDEHPGLLYWFERRPFLAAAVFCAGVAIAGVVVGALFAVSELP